MDSIIRIIQDKNLCNNWELDEDVLILDYKHYTVTLLYDNGYLYSIYQMKIKDKENIRTMKKIIDDYSPKVKVFIHSSNFYIQCKYKRFSEHVILDQEDFFNDIQYYLSLMLNKKKNIIFYPHKRINEEINPKSSYPIPSNLLP